MKKSVFIVFEGMDGVGKTTVSKAVAKKLSATHMTTPPKEFSDIRGIIDREYKNNGLAAHLFYASTVINASQLVKEKLEQQKSVVLDRYVMSTMAYDKAFRDSGISDNFWMDYIFNNLFIPDIVFYIHAPAELREKRMYKRNDVDNTDKYSVKNAKKIDSRYNAIVAMLEKRLWKIERVPNEESIDICVKKCIEKISNL